MSKKRYRKFEKYFDKETTEKILSINIDPTIGFKPFH